MSYHAALPCMTVDNKQKNAALESSEQSIKSFFSSELHKYDCDRSSSATVNYTYLCSLFDKNQKVRESESREKYHDTIYGH